MNNTIQQILDNLQKNQEDKKSQLNAIYEDHSTWLQNELSLIYKLINHNPREELINGTKIEFVPVANSSSSSNKEDDSFASKKRKSPETSADLKLSPEQKRTTVDIEELIAAAGLPSDLNKMKKESLLEELEKRGNTSFTMKHLKKDLIDALKECLLLEKRGNTASTTAMLENAPVNTTTNTTSATNKTVPPSPMVVSKPPLLPTTPGVPKTPGRKVSLMHEIRELVNQSSTMNEDIDEQQRKTQIENEFQARQSRHRASLLNSSNGFNSTSSSQGSTTSDSSMNSLSNTQDLMDIVSSPKPNKSNVIVQQQDDEEGDEDVIHVSRHNTTDTIDSKLSDKSSVSCSGNNSSILNTSHSSAATNKKDGKTTSKPVVHSLQAAKQAKAAEELKALNKKKEHEQRIAAKTAQPVTAKSTTSNATSTATTPKAPTSPWEKIRKGLTVSNKTTSDNTAANAQTSIVKKLGGLFGSKKTTTTTTTTANGVAPAVPVTTTVKPVFDISVVDTEKRVDVEEEDEETEEEAAVVEQHEEQEGEEESVEETIERAVVVQPACIPVTPVAAPAPTNAAVVEEEEEEEEEQEDNVDEGEEEASQCTEKTVPKTPSAGTGTAAATPSAATAMVVSPASPKTTVTSTVNINNNNSSPKSSPKQLFASPAKSTVATTVVREEGEVEETPVAPVSAPIAMTTNVVPPTPTAPITTTTTATPGNKPTAAPEAPREYEYPIEDASDSDEGSDTEDEEDSSAKKPSHPIPDWAKGDLFRQALERQYGMHGHAPMDPDTIFPEVQTCNLEEIFGRDTGMTRKYSARSSSAHWDADQLTLVEKRQYRNHMGYQQQAF